MRKLFYNKLCNQKSCLFVMMFIFCISLSYTQTISGIVEDAVGPVPGVNISVKGTTLGTQTDFDGMYSIEIPNPDAVLVFSYIGYKTQEIPVNGQTEINVTLEKDIAALDEIVVIGYGKQKKKLTTGANQVVSGDVIEKQNQTNALQGLQGQVAGVQITSTSGQPGSGLNVLIRGAGSTRSNQPLFVVDGVLTGDVSYLNNSDIESVSVLRDAASAAIYGSQAANGVVLITTKSGKAGKSQITFDSFYGVQTRPKDYDLLNARQYGTILNESNINSGLNPLFTNQQLDEYGEGTDWLDLMFEDTVTQNYSLGVSGGSETSTYSASLSYQGQEGIVGGPELSNYERYNFRINSEHKLLDGKLTFGQNLTFAWIDQNGIGVGGQYNNALRGAFATNPLVPLYDENGNFFNTAGSSEPWLVNQVNPYAAMVYGNQNESDSQKLLGNVYFKYDILEGLSFRTSLGLDYNVSQGHSYTPEFQLSSQTQNLFSRVNQFQNKNYSLIWDNTLTYDFNINKKHDFTAILGTSTQKINGTYLSGTNTNLIFDSLENAWLDNALNEDEASRIDLSGGPIPEAILMSYFGRVQYNFDEKYLLSFSLRADGSSNFGDENKWGYFPAASAGWVVTKEDFMKETKWLDFLKFRASWGQVGNQNIPAFSYLGRVTYNTTNYTLGNTEGALNPGVSIVSLDNQNIKWEASEQLNIGLDAGFLNNRLDVSLDWYNKTTNDWLIEIPIAATSGVTNQFINGGDVKNSGVELAVSYNSKFNEDFSYSVSLNGAYNQNEVQNIPTTGGVINGSTNQIWVNGPEFYRSQTGYPLWYFWGFKTNGVFQTEQDVIDYTNQEGVVIQPDASPGDIKYVDINGDGRINDDDKTEIGDPNPDFTFGFNLNLNYKAFDFFVQANGVAGNQIAQSYRNPTTFDNYSTEILDRWTGPGSSNDVPRVTNNNRNFSRFSDQFIKDGDFLRISTISLGYDFAKYTKKEDFFASQLRFYVSVLNAFTFTDYNGMDPEIGFGTSGTASGVDIGYYPRPRTFLMGVNFKF